MKDFYKILIQKLTSRTFWLVTIASMSGVAGAIFLPAVPQFEWLKPHTTSLYTAALALVTAYVGGNIADMVIRLKNGLKNGTGDKSNGNGA